MKIQLTCLLLLFTTCLFAQQKKTITRDTINIHGYVYDNTGKPVYNIYVESTALETEHNTFKIGAFTNDRGYFTLKAAKLNDTITIGPDVHYDAQIYYNHGSRFLAIYLPPAKMVEANSGSPYLITQKRRSPKPQATYTVTPIDSKINNDANLSPAKYPGGAGQLEAFIKQNLQYPENAVKANMEGIVQVTFTITKDGIHKDFKILRGVSDECDDEVLKVLKKTPNWQPALDHDQPVAMQVMLSVQFKLVD